MKLFFKGDVSNLMQGIAAFSKEFAFQVSEDGLVVNVEKIPDNLLEVSKSGNQAAIRYKEKYHFFRGLGLLLENLAEKDEFKVSEEPQFTMNGVMIDVAQGNSVIKVASVKKLIFKMAVMGLNMFMLYTEDNYELEGEPYFGNMRGRYTKEELKECDAYADIFGIEMIPCIQTLAHLYDALKWNCYADMRDDFDTLLVGCEKAYALIEKMIATTVATFKTKRIHIGMDEAWNLGLGAYLNQNGYRPKFDIMNEHLKRVLEITEKYGLKPMIWSDMYFRAGSKTGDYYDKECVIPQSVIDDMPKGVQFVYWDYYHHDKEFYIDWIQRHKKFGSDPIFAGAVWNWYGFGVNYGLTFSTTNAALEACKGEGIKEVFVTLWGDNGTENIVFSNLLGFQLFAEHGYARKLDEEKLKKRFKFCTGANYDDFMDIRYMDEVDPKNPYHGNPSQYLLWQDPMMGLFDKNIEGYNLSEHYAALQLKMKEHAASNGGLGFVFELYEKVCSVLSIKAEIGLKITAAYKNGDRSGLKAIADTELPELAARAVMLKDYHRRLWHEIYQPFGWEVIDIRYGGMLARIDSARARIYEYLDGMVEKLDELERERLYYYGKPEIPSCNLYTRIATGSRFSYLI